MAKDGFILLYRELLDKPIWKLSTPEQKTILITLLLMAWHHDNDWEWQGKKFKVFAGQFVTSIDSIMKEAGKGISFQNIRSALKRFEKLEFLTNDSTKTGRLITILKWHTYQVEKPRANKGTNKEVTKAQQRGNKEVTTNNECNNVKNVINKDIKSSVFIKPTIDELKSYCKERNNSVDYKHWLDHYTSNGWMVGKTKMKDWKAAIRTWEKNSFDKKETNQKQQEVEHRYDDEFYENILPKR